MALQTRDKRALVAGGTGRVGSEIAARLEADGWSVLAAGRSEGDLRSRAGARALAARALDLLGGLDLLVQAAGDGFWPRSVADVSEEDWDAAFDVTAKGTFFLAQAAADALRQEHGSIVILEDVASFQAWPSFAPHCAAKAAQAMLTRVLARALAPEVRVNGVAPGAVAVAAGQEERRAAETLLGRVGTPADVADAVLYLASADYVTGTTLVVDGGRLLKSSGSLGP
ncbi:MAG: pteridine reductase [Gaiellaceae bacterium]|nr:pteridine reductase [Gaiellaceae bacterium]